MIGHGVHRNGEPAGTQYDTKVRCRMSNGNFWHPGIPARCTDKGGRCRTVRETAGYVRRTPRRGSRRHLSEHADTANADGLMLRADTEGIVPGQCLRPGGAFPSDKRSDGIRSVSAGILVTCRFLDPSAPPLPRSAAYRYATGSPDRRSNTRSRRVGQARSCPGRDARDMPGHA